MGDYLERFDLWEAVGWAGQACYFGRFLLQWLASERAKKIVVPMAFWWMSLGGSVGATLYASHNHSLFFMAGPCINFFVVSRNIWLLRSGRPIGGKILTPFALGVTTVAVAVVFWTWEFPEQIGWLIVGAAGTFLWTIRFPVQWWLAERHNNPTLPPTFFWISLVGSVLLLVFACRTGNPIFIAGMALSPFLYTRSLMLCYRKPAAAS